MPPVLGSRVVRFHRLNFKTEKAFIFRLMAALECVFGIEMRVQPNAFSPISWSEAVRALYRSRFFSLLIQKLNRAHNEAKCLRL